MVSIKFSPPDFSNINLGGKGTIFDPEEWKRLGNQISRAPEHIKNFSDDLGKDPLKALANTLLPFAVTTIDPTSTIPRTTSPNDPALKRQEGLKALDTITKEAAKIGGKYLLYGAAAVAGVLILTRSRK